MKRQTAVSQPTQEITTPGGKIRIVDATAEQLLQLPCCGIKNVQHEAHQRKTAWLRENMRKGLRAKVLLTEDNRQCGYIEYLPGEHAWRAVEASGYMFVHCIWTFFKKYQRCGNAKLLVRGCIEDAKKAGMLGVAVVARQKPWLAGGDLFLNCGFEVVDAAAPDYQLLAIKFRKNAPNPRFRRIPEDAERERGRFLVSTTPRGGWHYGLSKTKN